MDNYIMCLSIVLYLLPPLVDGCSGNSASETVVTPRRRRSSVNNVYRQQGKQPPFDHVYKILFFPLSLAYACLGDHRDTFFRIVQPIPMHDLSFCHSSKQTTILAYIRVEC